MSDDTVRESRLSRTTVRAVQWTEDNGAYWLQVTGNIGMAIAAIVLGTTSGTSFGEWAIATPGIILWISILASAAGSYFQRRNDEQTSRLQRRLANLENEIKDLGSALNTSQEETFSVIANFNELIDEQLQLLSTKVLKLGHTERISIYKHDNDMFRQIGRFSKSPIYLKPGRGRYAEDQGCVGDAWNHGESLAKDFPDPDTALDDYLTVMEQTWNIPRHVASSFKMKSRSIAAFAIVNDQARPIGVIVFESTRTDVLNFEKLKQIVRGPEGRWFRSAVSRARLVPQSPSDAESEGL